MAIGHTGVLGLTVTSHVEMATWRACVTVQTPHRSMGESTAPEMTSKPKRAILLTVQVILKLP